MSVAPGKWWRDEETGDLELDVSKVSEPRRFDSPEHGIEPWKKVDFVFHWPETKELWLVEVKDPDNPCARDSKRLIEDFGSEKLIYRELSQKGKDSFLYLFLQHQLPEAATITYFALFACERLKPARQASHYLNATKALRRGLALEGPHGVGWARRGLYIDKCMILSLAQWNDKLGERVKVQRLSAESAT